MTHTALLEARLNPLDNPAWIALTTEQKDFGVVGSLAARYRADISPIAAVADDSIDATNELSRLVDPEEVVAVIGAGPVDTSLWRELTTIELTQWVCETFEPFDLKVNWVELGDSDVAEMRALVKATDPGPFEAMTHHLGDYVGVRVAGELVSMTGERICLAGYREVSAVCTAEGFGGRGYAQGLVAEITARQHRVRCISFLHVRVGSPAEKIANRVYAKLGYRERAHSRMKVLRRQQKSGEV
jgi:predicted GNAT family acetyltransferase